MAESETVDIYAGHGFQLASQRGMDRCATIQTKQGQKASMQACLISNMTPFAEQVG